MNPSAFRELIATQGFAILQGVLPSDKVLGLRRALERAIAEEAEDHRANGRSDMADVSMVLLCSLYGAEFLDLFEILPLTAPFEWVLGEGCIVYAYTSSSMRPRGSNYSTRIHVDCPRLIDGYVTNMGATILLDDFTLENGATWFLPASQTLENAPSNEEFYGRGERVIAPAGSVFYFNARLWHAGGSNETDLWRHALTINMCRSYMKQRIDIPRAMKARGISPTGERARQKLGFLAQVPAGYEEYYLPPEERPFQQRAE
jgi:ectoine hydroxylase-related dioxygenase (phytanoyl-CoA dioxygenase family)